ncbi:hypothetical protein [Treponema sp. Marseille-Q3903]|uniref:hypothetical protein n=1 Tax=Treponema sp. Marseille-Q3903 TaxID=2766703 RepID=UPI00165263A3|nr:hypothetical protein [Treponema sp. Marseille-Q3903]MBC6714110.1 hypothetical protein [Treponema sp. Marseille-Q3903]
MKKNIIKFINRVFICCLMLFFISCVNQLENNDRDNDSKNSTVLSITIDGLSGSSRKISSDAIDISTFDFELEAVCSDGRKFSKSFKGEEYLKEKVFFISVLAGSWKFTLTAKHISKPGFPPDKVFKSVISKTIVSGLNSVNFTFSGKGSADISIKVPADLGTTLGIAVPSVNFYDTLRNSHPTIKLYDLEDYKKNKASAKNLSAEYGVSNVFGGTWGQKANFFVNRVWLSDIPSGAYYVTIEIELDNKTVYLVQENLYITPGEEASNPENKFMIVNLLTKGGIITPHGAVQSFQPIEAGKKYLMAKSDFFLAPNRFSPKKYGFAFKGWYLDDETFSKSLESQLKEDGNDVSNSTKNLSLYAKWYEYPDVMGSLYGESNASQKYIFSINSKNLGDLPTLSAPNDKSYEFSAAVEEFVLADGNVYYVRENANEFRYANLSSMPTSTPFNPLNGTLINIPVPVEWTPPYATYLQKIYRDGENIYFCMHVVKDSDNYIGLLKCKINDIAHPSFGYFEIGNAPDDIDFAVSGNDLYLYYYKDGGANFLMKRSFSEGSNKITFANLISHKQLREEIYKAIPYKGNNSSNLSKQTVFVNDMLVFDGNLYLLVVQHNITESNSSISDGEHAICTGQIIKLSGDSLAVLNRFGKAKTEEYKNTANNHIFTSVAKDENDYMHFIHPARFVAIDPEKKKLVFSERGSVLNNVKVTRFVYFDLDSFIPGASVDISNSYLKLIGLDDNTVGFSGYDIKVDD